MNIHGIRAKMVRRFKVTTRSRSTQAVAPDLVQRQFMIHQPNHVWTSDITYIWTREGWVYLAVVLDMCSRMIVGWEPSSRLTAVTESFFHTLKTEHIYFHHYETRQNARTSIFEYIETFYNQQCLHSSLGNRSPMQFELQLTMT
jgi:transposase InsO family protein